MANDFKVMMGGLLKESLKDKVGWTKCLIASKVLIVWSKLEIKSFLVFKLKVIFP